MTDAEQHKKKYRTNLEYRQRKIKAVGTRHERLLADPRTRENYKRLLHLRKKISQRRDQIKRQLDKCAGYEAELFELVGERDKLAAHLRYSDTIAQ